MTALGKLDVVEVKLLRRDPMSLFWGLIFPALLLVVLGLAFPGFTDPSEDLGGHRAIDLYVPIAIGLGVATIGLGGVPVYLAGYREKGVLRRMSTTPVPPRLLLAAMLAVHLAAAIVAATIVAATIVAATIAVAVAILAFDVPAPRHAVEFGLGFALAAASLYSIGLLLGSIARTASAAQGIGMLLYFPMLFFAGVYFPRQVMPDGLRTVSDFTPAGAAVAVLEDAWLGSGASASSLAVMAAFTAGTALVAAKVFRWE